MAFLQNKFRCPPIGSSKNLKDLKGECHMRGRECAPGGVFLINKWWFSLGPVRTANKQLCTLSLLFGLQKVDTSADLTETNQVTGLRVMLSSGPWKSVNLLGKFTGSPKSRFEPLVGVPAAILHGPVQ